MVRRDAVTAARACGARATGTPWRATATTSAIERERPSMVTGVGMREEATSGSGEPPRETPTLNVPTRRLDASASTSKLPPARSSPVPSAAPAPGSPNPSARPVDDHVLAAHRGDTQARAAVLPASQPLEHVAV